MSDDAEYERAQEALSTLISGRQRADGKNWAHAFDMMKVYLERLGLDEELPKLSVIHVAGTKGKGSTSAMVESLLRKCGYRTGLYTSPHLIDVRERIRINGVPVPKDVFLENLWETFNTLQAKCDEEAGMPAYFRFLTLLGFKVFLQQKVDVVVLEVGIGGRLDATNCVREPVVCGVTSLGFDHMELLGNTLPEIAREKAGIFKPGRPAFTVPQPEDALAALQEVAQRVGAPLQVTPSWDSFRPAVSGRQLRLGLAGEHQKLNASLALMLAATWEADSPVAAAKQGGATAQRAQQLLEQGLVAEEYAEGLEAASWPGRGQIVYDESFDAEEQQQASSNTAGAAGAAAGGQALANGHSSVPPAHLPRLTFYMDGAHTPESMATCANWFADATAPASAAAAAAGGVELVAGAEGSEGGEGVGAVPPLGSGPAAAAAAAAAAAGGGSSRPVVVQRVLLFNCMQERDPQNLLQPLAQTLAERRVQVHHALFVPPTSTYMKLGPAADAAADLSWQHSLRGVWESQASVAVRKQGARAAAAAPGIVLPALPALPALPLQDTARGAVLPNLQVTLEWLRRCVRETPSLRMQVLVAGSLYLVGDLLKLLGKSV